MEDPKSGIKTTEFYATVGIAGLPIAQQLGWFDKMPVTEGGETALWLSAGLIVSVYVLTRAWVKVSAYKYGGINASTTSSTSSTS